MSERRKGAEAMHAAVIRSLLEMERYFRQAAAQWRERPDSDLDPVGQKVRRREIDGYESFATGVALARDEVEKISLDEVIS